MPEEIPNRKYRTIDLFAGIGGIRLGFEKFGFKTVFANDYDTYCKQTYDRNFMDTPLTLADITKVKVEELPDFDILLGGFPCQPFSVAGYRKGFNDEKGRGDLFFYIARIIEQRQPMGFMLENVRHLETHDKGNTYKIIKKTLENLGYHIKHKILNGMEYGNLPQNRERIYIIGFKDKDIMNRFAFPNKISLEKSVSDVLLPENEVEEKFYYNGKPLYDRIKDDVTEQGKVYQWRRHYVRKNKSGVCPTLTANMGTGGHNVPIIIDNRGIRKLTPRECLRLQGFKDDYTLGDISLGRAYKQIGNSVNVTVVERIAKKMFFALEKLDQLDEVDISLSNIDTSSLVESVA